MAWHKNLTAVYQDTSQADCDPDLGGVSLTDLDGTACSCRAWTRS